MDLKGGLVVNKPTGITSHDTLDKLRKILPDISIGHTGTLDPQATGVLFVLLGKATKIASFIEGWDKEYLAKIKLGVKTDTYDLEGKVLEVVEQLAVTETGVKETVDSLVGEISQAPPLYSAIKYKGRKLYEYARAGVEITPEKREVSVKRMGIINMNLPDLQLRILCSKGTYIRSIANEIGEKLGCGAVLAALSRTRVGQYDLERALTLKQIEEIYQQNQISDYIIAIPEILKNLPRVLLKKDSEEKVKNGAELKKENIFSVDDFKAQELVKVVNTKSEVLAIGKFLISSQQLNQADGKKIFKYLRVLN